MLWKHSNVFAFSQSPCAQMVLQVAGNRANRCPNVPLATGPPLCLSTCSSYTKDAKETRPRKSNLDPHNPQPAMQALVFSILELKILGKLLSVWTCFNKGHCGTQSQHGCMETERERLLRLDCSTVITSTMLASRRALHQDFVTFHGRHVPGGANGNT